MSTETTAVEYLITTPVDKKRKKEKPEIFCIKPKLIDNTTFNGTNATKDLSKSSQKLLKIFGEKEFIISFNKARKMLKTSKNDDNLECYENQLAVVEVKLKNLKSEYRSELSQLEMEIMEENDGINAIPEKNQTPRYNYLVKTLQLIKLLHKELNL